MENTRKTRTNRLKINCFFGRRFLKDFEPTWLDFGPQVGLPKSQRIQVASKSRPRRAQERPKRVPRAPKSAPRAPQGYPRAPQELPKGAQERPKSVPRASQERVKSAQERPKSAQERTTANIKEQAKAKAQATE